MLRWLVLISCAMLGIAHAQPRLVFRAADQAGLGRSFEEVRKLYREDDFFRSTFALALEDCETSKNPAALASCWIVTEKGQYATAAVAALRREPITESGSGAYSNVWSFALAWDWLRGHTALPTAIRTEVRDRIVERLRSELDQLDDGGMSLWHGRTQATNGAMVAALAVADGSGYDKELERATAHYVEALKALAYSEGWPEGPSYWIYNRALPFALAADCYLTATGTSEIAGMDLRRLMRDIGLWSVYQYGPNGIFEPLGDSQGSLRLGETGYWEASVDYFAKLSRDAGLAAGADYFRVKSPSPYGRRPVHWWTALAYDPSIRPTKDFDPKKPELWMRANLPQAKLFGRDSMGTAFLRGAWGDKDEVFASFKAGDFLAHHDHYDVGHFSIQLRGLLAPLTGAYDGSHYTGAYRLGYAIQTVSSNSLLIAAPNETAIALERQPEKNWVALSGGQRVISPTGSSMRSLAHYERQRASGAMERATITAFRSVPGTGDYIVADLTAAYNSTRFSEAERAPKVSLVTRQFAYLRKEGAFVVFDRVETTNPAYRAKVLLHSIAKPESASETQIGGNSPDDGILETRERTLRIPGEGSALTQSILLPKSPRTRKIGGANHYAYVEPVGEAAPGVNLNTDPGKALSGAKPRGLWRVEVEDADGTDRKSHRFLQVLTPRVPENKAVPETELLASADNVVAARVGDTSMVFSASGERLNETSFQVSGGSTCWVLDLQPETVYAFRKTPSGSVTSGGSEVRSDREGLVVVPCSAGSWELEKRSTP